MSDSLAPEESEEDKKEEEEKEEPFSDTTRTRWTTVLILVLAVASGYVTHITVGFFALTAIGSPIVFGLISTVLIHLIFGNATKKTLLYCVLLTLVIWFMTGTFLLNI